jgi:hypothetical protein
MPGEELRDLRDELKRLGAALGLSPKPDETSVAYATRCTQTARKLRMGAGVTWADYALIKADRGQAVFGLKDPPSAAALGGPRWTVRALEGLDELAAHLGTYEEAVTT